MGRKNKLAITTKPSNRPAVYARMSIDTTAATKYQERNMQEVIAKKLNRESKNGKG